MKQKPELRVGLIGSGFMGRCHSNAFRSVGGLFDLPLDPVADMLADISDEAAATNAAAMGFQRYTGDWGKLCVDPAIDLVAVTAPNALHEPIVLAALAAGKSVYCEKPLSTTLECALRMTEAAEKVGAVTMVGFNFYGRKDWTKKNLINWTWEFIHNRVTANTVNRFKQLCEWKFENLGMDWKTE